MQQAQPLGAPPPLAELTSEASIALFLDFDGTLVDIASGPDAIVVDPDLPALLLDLHDALEGRLALVSGRSIADLERHLGSLPIARAGSHGAECILGNGQAIAEPPPPVPDALKDELAQLGARHAGLKIEEKSFGIGLHFRSNPELAGTIKEQGRCLAESYGMSMKTGKCVVELMTTEADKGAAVRRFMAVQQFRSSRPLFLGDDVTDEDGFTACNRMGGLGIAVGERASQNAQYHLGSTTAVHDWLKL